MWYNISIFIKLNFVSKQTDKLRPPHAELQEFAVTKDPEGFRQIEARQKELERAYVERQLDVGEKIERLKEKIKRRERELIEVYLEIERLKDELDTKHTNTIAKFFNILEIRSLRKNLGIEVTKAGDLRREFDGLLVLYDDLEKESKSQVELDEADKMASEFYSVHAQELEKIKAHEKEKQARDVTNVSRKHNAVLTHSFLSWKGAGQVSVMKRGVGWKDMLHATLSMEPHISTASVRLDNDKTGYPDESFFALGALLKGGEITSANEGDAGTGATGGERLGGFSKDQMEGAIDEAINKPTIGHNEIAVRCPKVAALFFDSNVLNRLTRNESLTEHGNVNLLDEIFEEGRQLGMPVYMRDKESGKYFLVTGVEDEEYRENYFEKAKRRVVRHVEKPASIEDILNSDFQLTNEQKDEMKKRVLAGDSFNDLSAVLPKDGS